MAFDEKHTVQDWLVKRLVGLGWTYEPATHLQRSNTDVLIEEDLMEALVVLNPAIGADEERLDEVLPRIRGAVTAASTDGLVVANERLVTFMRGDVNHRYIGTPHDVPLCLVDFDDLANNTYVVSDEVVFGPPGDERRYDVVLFINGLPVVVIEAKTPVNSSVTWLKGAKDIADVYAPEGPSFFAPNVLCAATDGKEFHYGAIGQPATEWLMWGSTQDPYDLDGLPRVERSVDLLLTPQSILSILRDPAPRRRVLPHRHCGRC